VDSAQGIRPRRGDELELRIDRLAYGGAGVARANGYVVFVRDGVPGDRVRARITRSKRSFAEADAVELLEPSPDRLEPLAPHPGAPWQVLPYERQLAEKEAQVRDALERLGGFEQPPVERIVPAEQRLRYRNKVEYSFGADEEDNLVLGFHRRGRFDLIDDVSQDILASERVDELREVAKAWCREEGLSAWDRRGQSGLLRNLVVREGRRTGLLQARVVTSPGAQFRGISAVDPRRERRGDHPRGRDRAHQGEGGARGGNLRSHPSHLARRVLSDEHRDGRAALRRGRGASRAERP
jgi:23S rRNA (uracil1939-C5)-methyltransferase